MFLAVFPARSRRSAAQMTIAQLLGRDFARLPFSTPSRILGAVNVTVTELTNRLLNSYARVGGINHLDGKNLPSKRAIALITVDLLRLLFPGFFDEKTLHSSELKVETTTLMDSVLGRLEDEIYKSLENYPPPAAPKKDLRPLARQLTLEVLSSLPKIREVLQTDVEAAFNGDPAA